MLKNMPLYTRVAWKVEKSLPPCRLNIQITLIFQSGAEATLLREMLKFSKLILLLVDLAVMR